MYCQHCTWDLLFPVEVQAPLGRQRLLLMKAKRDHSMDNGENLTPALSGAKIPYRAKYLRKRNSWNQV